MTEEVRDYLIRFTNRSDAMSRASDWVRKDEKGKEQIQPPSLQSVFQIQPYSDMGKRAQFNAKGIETKAGVKSTKQSGHWYLMTLPASQELPAKLHSLVKASGLRSKGLKLPTGVKGFDTIIAGMKIV